MTTSPYDRLPTGAQEPAETPAGYVEVPLETLQEEPEPTAAPESAVSNHTEVPVSAAPAAVEIEADSSAETPKQTLPAAPEKSAADSEENTLISLPQAHTTSGSAKTISMEQPPQHRHLSMRNRVGTVEYTMPFEESLLVPDTMPDIKKILFTEGQVHLSQPQKSSYEKSDILSGDITFYTVYQPDAEGDTAVDVIKSTIPFKTDRCWGSSSDTFIQLQISLKSTTAKMINERKLMAKGELSIRFTQISAKELLVYQGCDDPDFVPLQNSISVTEATQFLEETTEISQEITRKEEQPQPVKILKESFRIVENHRQITSGKLVLNATIHTDLLYLGEKDGEQTLYSMHQKTDFTQFILLKGEPDPDLIQTTYRIEQLHCSIQSEQDFLLQGQILTQIQIYENQSLSMILDAYHKTQELNFDFSQQPLCAVCDTVCGEISAREVINLDESDQTPAVLLNGICQLQNISGTPEQSRIVIDGTLQVVLLALTEENQPFVINGTIPLRGALESAETRLTENFTADIAAQIKEFWFDHINTRQIELNVSVALNVWSCSCEQYQTIQNTGFLERAEPARRISLAIYTVAPEDTLWKIAKHYQVDMESLAQLNQLSSDAVISEGTKLLVMKS